MEFDWNKPASTREKVLFALILLLATILFLRGLYVEKLLEARQVQVQLKVLQAEASVLRQFLERTPTITPTPASRTSDDIKIQVLDETLESPFRDLPTLLPRLTDRRFLEGIRIISLSFQPATSEGGYTRVDFTMEAAGSFGEVVSFLERLEELPALFHVRDLVVSTEPGRGTEVRAELSLRFFKRGEEAIRS